MCEEEENSNIMKFRIAICAILLIIATSSNTTELNNFILFLSAYLIIGGDVILKALKHILKGKVFVLDYKNFGFFHTFCTTL